MDIRVVAIVVALASSGTAVADGWAIDTTAGLVAYENVGKSRNRADYRGATALEIDVVAQTQPAWQTPGVVSFEVWAGLDRFDTLTGLNQLRAGIAYPIDLRIDEGDSFASLTRKIKSELQQCLRHSQYTVEKNH